MATKIKNIELLYNVFGDDARLIIDKLEKENIKITNRSGNFMLDISNLLFNYIDFIHGGNKTVIEDKTITEIKSEYEEWVCNFNYSKYDKLINENIIFDYRVNGVGFYWVDLKSHFSCDMMFNMENCGRVGVNQNIIILKEQKENGENIMQVAISISKDHYIVQIKGKKNIKPTKYYDYIFDFFLKYEPIIGFKQVFKPEEDFTVSDLTKEDNEKLRLVKPHLSVNYPESKLI